MTTKVMDAIKALKAPATEKHSKHAFNTEEVYAIRDAVLKGHKLRDIAKACELTLPGLYSKMGIWALHNLPVGNKPRGN